MAETEKQKPAKSETTRPNAGAKGQVGRDIPDESKERHTEIAVEAGNKGMHSKTQK